MPNNDLISRAAAIAALTDTNIKRNVDSLCDGDMNRTRRAAQRVIAQLPAVDAMQVVHGTWGRYYDGDHCTEYIVCSNCGAEYDSDIVFAYHNGESRLELEGLEHCPHCSAKMDAPTCGPDYCEIGGGDDADG